MGVYIDYNIAIVISVVILAFYLFVKEVFPVDVTALIIMGTLMLLKVVTPEEGISGFSNHAVITILAMFILSAGIEKTGILNVIGLKVFNLVGSNQYLQLLVVMLLAAPFSGFLNNAAVVAVMLPFVMNLTKISKTSPGKLLIPLSYVSMSGGMLTLIGTSTNLLANSILPRFSLQEFNMFSFWGIGMIVLLITVVYFMLVGIWILPSKKNNSKDDIYENLNYTVEINVRKGSPLIGKEVKDTVLRTKYKVKIIRLERDKNIWDNRFSNRILQEGDILTIDTDRETLMDLETEKNGIDIAIEDFHKKDEPIETLQMIVPQESKFIGKKIRDIHLEQKYKALVIAVRKGQQKITKRIDDLKLHVGDMLLIKTTAEYAEKLKQEQGLMKMDHVEVTYRKDKRVHALMVMLGVVIFAALGIYPILVTSIVGVILMLWMKILTPEEAYGAIRWDIIFLLAGLIPLGIAVEKSGTAALIASFLSKLIIGWPLLWVLIGFYVFTTLLTEILSNNASVILLVPIGIDLALRLQTNPYLFVLVIMFAASTSFLTPVGYKTNTMIYGTGVYKFSDFFKVGVMLNLILAFVTPYLILKMWTGI